MNTIRITTSQNIELEYDLASLGERIGAFALDLLVVFAYLIIISIVVNVIAVSGNQSGLIYFLLFLPAAFYNLLSEIFLNGQTLGKRVLKIKVISITGTSASIGQYMIRWLFRLIDIFFSFCTCALISVAVSDKKQRVGDMVAGTTLIKTQPRTAFNQTMYVPTPEINYTVSYPAVTSLSDKDIQLIKEALLHISKTNNLYLAYPVAEKVKKMLNIETNLDPSHFLQTVVADYNYLTSRG
jgi:uncharacterized RDD family membrane protein YckC